MKLNRSTFSPEASAYIAETKALHRQVEEVLQNTIDAQDATIKALVEAVENERENVCQDFGMQLKLSEAVDSALAAAKETT